MSESKGRGSPRTSSRGRTEYERFDVENTSSGEEPRDFASFDVQQDESPKPEALLEALSDFAEGGQDIGAVLQARKEAEERFLVDPSQKAFAMAADGPAGLGNVLGVALGEKVVNGVPTGQLAVKILVKEKLNREEVSEAAMVPQDLGGVLTDVDATGEIRAQFFTARQRPAPCGVSIGNCTMTMAGTLGCLVSRGNQLFLLSNNHVMALVNTSPLGAGIPQPGLLDHGLCPQDIIARLSQFIPIVFSGANQVDAAIARTSPELVDRRILRPGGALQKLVAPDVPPALNMMVQKSGRTTQYRRGIVDAVNATMDVSYAPLGGIARFTGQFRVRGINSVFSDRGDSGSLVTTFPGNQPVGLLFAGNAANNYTFCNPISSVLNALSVRIVY